MSHYVVSDIHGEGERFHRLLERIRFSEKDTLYILGDVIDRGPDGVALLEEIRRRPNMVLLLGNHEYMCLQYHAPEAAPEDRRRWDRNGNGPTLAGLAALSEGERSALLEWLAALPVCLELEVEGRRYHLVHGFPGSSVYDQVWGRPRRDTPNPFPDGRQVIVGHTPVTFLYCGSEAEELRYLERLEETGRHLRVCKAPGFWDIDCCCGYDLYGKRLACLRLEDGAEIYI